MPMTKQCLIIGYGSAGQRHARLLKQSGCKVELVTSRKISKYPFSPSIHEALKKNVYDYTVVCNETSAHFDTVKTLLKKGVTHPILVEKPLFEKSHELDMAADHVVVGYHLRFHPMLKKIHTLIKDKPLYTMQVYCGQYLPDWRPGRDYRKVYSADSRKGGGVLRDLSHELDYIQWIAGQWDQMVALEGRFSNLEISSEDSVSLMMRTSQCPLVTLHLNYLDKQPKREIIINAEDLFIKADLISGIFQVNDRQEKLNIELDQVYLNMHLAVLEGELGNICDFGTGNEILDMIQAIEQSSEEHRWVKRK